MCSSYSKRRPSRCDVCRIGQALRDSCPSTPRPATATSQLDSSWSHCSSPSSWPTWPPTQRVWCNLYFKRITTCIALHHKTILSFVSEFVCRLDRLAHFKLISLIWSVNLSNYFFDTGSFYTYEKGARNDEFGKSQLDVFALEAHVQRCYPNKNDGERGGDDGERSAGDSIILTTQITA